MHLICNTITVELWNNTSHNQPHGQGPFTQITRFEGDRLHKWRSVYAITWATTHVKGGLSYASSNWLTDSSTDGFTENEPSYHSSCYGRVTNNWLHIRTTNLHSWKCFPLTCATLILIKYCLFMQPWDTFSSSTKMYERLPMVSWAWPSAQLYVSWMNK